VCGSVPLRDDIVWRPEGGPRSPGKGRAACGFLAAGRGVVTSAVGCPDSREMCLSSSTTRRVAARWLVLFPFRMMCSYDRLLLSMCKETVKALGLRGRRR
jgi:hypothetical protein